MIAQVDIISGHKKNSEKKVMIAQVDIISGHKKK